MGAPHGAPEARPEAPPGPTVGVCTQGGVYEGCD